MFSKEKGTGSASPSCRVVREKSIVLASSRGVVPVFSLPTENPSPRRESESFIAGKSPARPAGKLTMPMWTSPFRKVPVHRTVAFPR